LVRQFVSTAINTLSAQQQQMTETLHYKAETTSLPIHADHW